MTIPSLIDFITMKKKLNEENEIVEEEFDEEKITEFFVRYPLTNADELSNAEEKILYYLSGHTIFTTIKRKFKHCSDCLPKAMRKGYGIDIAKFQELKDYTGAL